MRDCIATKKFQINGIIGCNCILSRHYNYYFWWGNFSSCLMEIELKQFKSIFAIFKGYFIKSSDQPLAWYRTKMI